MQSPITCKKVGVLELNGILVSNLFQILHPVQSHPVQMLLQGVFVLSFSLKFCLSVIIFFLWYGVEETALRISPWETIWFNFCGLSYCIFDKLLHLLEKWVLNEWNCTRTKLWNLQQALLDVLITDTVLFTLFPTFGRLFLHCFSPAYLRFCPEMEKKLVPTFACFFSILSVVVSSTHWNVI